MYCGLLFLLGESSKERQDKLDWLRQRLKMTPMERIAWVYEENQDRNFFRVAGLYSVFVDRMNDPEVRGLLGEHGPGYEERYEQRIFAQLKANSDALVAEFLRFIMNRRGDWTERFFEYLFF
jgi:hypothetical protein